MKVRHTFPAGHATASKIKALLLCLEAKRGAAAADAWLAKVRLGRPDLVDETRLLPLGALKQAVEAFVAEVEGGLDEVAPYLVAPENLGVWARVLRGARGPEDAFARLDASESEHGRTTRWETIDAEAGRWRGRVHVLHDPALEEDGSLAKARAVELAVVPMLFGYARGTVTMHASATDPPSQEYEVRWDVATTTRGLLVGASFGVAIGAGTLAAHASAIGAGIALTAPILGGALGLAWAQGQARRVDAKAQAVRVSALERSLALRETEESGAAGDLEGTVVAGQYRVGARMGSGASGVIYQATRITDGLPVAIKLLRAATAHDTVASDRLRREAEALGLSWHPNVVEVIDHGHLPDGTSYLVMELLVGESLATLVKKKGHLSTEELLPIAMQVCDALVAIHAAGVVHRDLKPSNIYLVRGEDGAAGRAKILDFGIARVEWEEMRITNIGAPLGTPGYMSPEQEAGGDVDARSDVYAVGAVLYECIVGEPPPPSRKDMWKPGSRPTSVPLRAASSAVDADSGVHPASRRLPSAAPAPLTAADLDAPPELRAIVEKALAKRREDRYQDARALLVALRGVGRGAAGRGTPHASST